LRAGKRRRLSPSLAAAGLVLAIAAIAAAARGAEAAPTQFTLTLDGSHVPDSGFPAGLRHEGPFTASAPFCSKGRAVDTKDVSDVPPVGAGESERRRPERRRSRCGSSRLGRLDG